MPRVVADAAEVKFQRCIAQGESGDSGNADVDGVTENVHAVRCDAACCFVKKRVGLRGAISADDIDWSARMTDGLIELVEQVEEAGIHVAIFMNAPITEKAIELCLSRRQVVISLTVDNVEAAARVQVIEHKAVVFDKGRLRCGWENREEREE